MSDKVTHTTFGYCMHPTSAEHNCPGKFQRFTFGKVKKGRKKVDGIIFLDEWIHCDCKCHKER